MAVPARPGRVEGGTDGRDLTVHHPARCDDVGAGLGLHAGQPGVEGNVASLSTSPVAGSRTPQCPWSVNSSRQQSAITTMLSPTASRTAPRARAQMPSGEEGGRPGGILVLGLGHAEEDDGGDPEGAQPLDLDDERVEAVLHDARQRGHRPRLREPVGHEERGHEVVDARRVLGDQPAERCAVRRKRPAHALDDQVRERCLAARPGQSLRQHDRWRRRAEAATENTTHSVGPEGEHGAPVLDDRSHAPAAGLAAGGDRLDPRPGATTKYHLAARAPGTAGARRAGDRRRCGPEPADHPLGDDDLRARMAPGRAPWPGTAALRRRRPATSRCGWSRRAGGSGRAKP